MGGAARDAVHDRILVFERCGEGCEGRVVHGLVRDIAILRRGVFGVWACNGGDVEALAILQKILYDDFSDVSSGLSYRIRDWLAVCQLHILQV